MVDKHRRVQKKQRAPGAKDFTSSPLTKRDQNNGQTGQRPAQDFFSYLTALDEFEKEMERAVSQMEAPPLSYFRELIQKAKPQIKRGKAIETLSFLVVALSYLFLVGYSIDAGYLLPVMIFFSVAWILIPTVLLFSRDFRKERGSEE